MGEATVKEESVVRAREDRVPQSNGQQEAVRREHSNTSRSRGRTPFFPNTQRAAQEDRNCHLVGKATVPGEAGTTTPMVHYAQCTRQAASMPSLAGSKLLVFLWPGLVTGPVVWCLRWGCMGGYLKDARDTT